MYLNVASTSAIFDYASLVSEVSDQLDRDDLTDKFPRFVQLVEAFLLRELRLLDMETTAQLTGSGQVFPLPDDCLSFRSLNVAGTPIRELRGISPASVPLQFNGEAGLPEAYSRIGDTIYLYPAPASSVTLDLVYLARFTPLTETSVSNWVLNDHPDVYFYGVLAHACAFIEDPVNAQIYSGLFEATVEGLKQARNSDRWGSGPLVPNMARQVRSAPC